MRFCLCSVLMPPSSQEVSKSEVINLSNVPEVHHDLQHRLPPHRPYDCAIDLLVGAPLDLLSCIQSFQARV